MADVNGMLADPDFNKLDPATQRQALGRLDSSFNGLSDSDYQSFRQRVTTPALPAYGDNAGWQAKTGKESPGFFGEGGTVDRFIKGTGLSNIPNDLSESVGNFVHNPTPGNLPIVGPSIDSATRLLTGRSASPIHDIANSVPIVGPAANAVGEHLARGEYPEAAGGATALLAPGLHGEPSPGLNLAEGDTLTPGFGSRAASGMKAAAPQVGKGLAKIGAGATAFEAIPGEAGRFIVGYPLVRSGMHDVGRGVSAGMEQFRGPVQGPEVAPKGFKSPYPTLPYEPPLPPAEPRPAFSRPDWTPPALERSEPTGKPGAVLPSGSIGGPASPSRVNPPAPRGNPPRVPQWERMGITGQPQPSVPDASPIYPASPVLESGRVIGPRPGEMPNPRAVVVNGGERPAAAVSGSVAPPPVAPAPIQPSGVPRIGQTPGERITALSQSPEGTVGTRAEMMRQLRLADQSGAGTPEKAAIIRRFEAPEYTPRPDRPFVEPRESEVIAPEPPSVPDTPAGYRARVSQSRGKFDASGKRK